MKKQKDVGSDRKDDRGIFIIRAKSKELRTKNE